MYQPKPTDRFYAVCLYAKNCNTQWSVFFETPEGLCKLWPMMPANVKLNTTHGFKYNKPGSKYPAYTIKINEVGTRHDYLVQETIAYILNKEFGYSGCTVSDINCTSLN